MYYFQNDTQTKFIKFDGLIATIVTFGDGMPAVKKYDTIWDEVPFGTVKPSLPRVFDTAYDAASRIINNRKREAFADKVPAKRVKRQTKKVFA